jgi:hypothetical protein
VPLQLFRVKVFCFPQLSEVESRLPKSLITLIEAKNCVLFEAKSFDASKRLGKFVSGDPIYAKF